MGHPQVQVCLVQQGELRINADDAEVAEKWNPRAQSGMTVPQEEKPKTQAPSTRTYH